MNPDSPVDKRRSDELGASALQTAREHILGRLRASAPATTDPVDALDARIDAHFAARHAATPDMMDMPDTSNAPNGLNPQQERVQQFQRALEASHVDVFCMTADAWPAGLARRLEKAGVQRLLMDTSRTEGAALARALPATVTTWAFDRPIEAWKTELFDTIDAGFTVARSGIAATGTLIVEPDAGSPRTVSLVPPLHVALVYADTLHDDLHAAVATERWYDGMPTNLVMISGPSKTSDIQQTLAYGAHGPRALWVVIVVDQGREAETEVGAEMKMDTTSKAGKE